MTYDRAALLAELERDEGRRLFPYLDPVGKITIGVGHNLSDVGITSEEADRLLDEDIMRTAAALDAAVPWWRGLGDVRQRALVNWAFNCGIGGLMTFKNTLRAIQDGNWALAGAGMRASLWHAQTGARAERLAKMIETGRCES